MTDLNHTPTRDSVMQIVSLVFCLCKVINDIRVEISGRGWIKSAPSHDLVTWYITSDSSDPTLTTVQMVSHLRKMFSNL